MQGASLCPKSLIGCSILFVENCRANTNLVSRKPEPLQSVVGLEVYSGGRFAYQLKRFFGRGDHVNRRIRSVNGDQSGRHEPLSGHGVRSSVSSAKDSWIEVSGGGAQTIDKS